MIFPRRGSMRATMKFRLLTFLIMCSLWRACCCLKIHHIEFMVGFPENRNQGDVILRITVTNAGGREIEVLLTSDIAPQQQYFVPPATSYTVTLGNEFMVKGSTKTSQGIHITTTGLAAVYVEEDPVSGPREGTMIIPKRFLGREYTVVMGVPSEGAMQSEILLVGLKDDTFVSVTINSTTGVLYENNTYDDGETINLLLSKFDTAQIQSEGSDLTGTLIVASTSISVFSANQAIIIDKKDGFLLEQMTPMKFWHTHYVTFPPIGSLYDCRIVAALPDTLVWYHCGTSGWQSVTLPNTGYDVLLQFGDAICKVFTTGPVMLTIIIHSVTHDPSMVVLQPLCEIHKTVAFHVPVSLESAQIMFATYIDDLNYITLDNDYVTNLHITPIEPDLVGVFGYVQSGTHFIRTSGLSLRISGYVFGRHGSETYGLSLQAGRNSSFVFDTGTTEILNNNKYESTATPLTYDTEITTQVRDENNLEQSINSVTVDDTVSTASGTAKSVGTSESSSTETKGISASGNLETSQATTVASGFTTSEITPDEIVSKTTLTTIQKSETKIASGITAYEKPPEATMITAIVTSGPNTETTASKVKAAPKPTTEATTTTFMETTESNIQTTTVKTARKTVAGTSQPLTKTTAAIFYGTSVAHGDTNLMTSEGTTTAVTNEITSIDWNTSPESKRPTETSVLCGTANPYSIKNMKCFMYCRNYTRDMDIRLVNMRANLIDRKKTRRYIRTLTSAQDDRMSVQTIGYTGVIVLVSVFLFIVFLDFEACKPRKRNQRSPV